MSRVHFTKMQGIGNDYVYVDATREPLPEAAALAVRWSDRHFGIGGDGLILIEKPTVEDADFRMRMFNNDGSEGAMCGNGVRCVGKFVYDKGLTRRRRLVIETGAGLKRLSLLTGVDGKVSAVTVDMGEPVLSDRRLIDTPDGSMREGTVEAAGRSYRGTFVSMGNPHFVIFVDRLEDVDLTGEGKALEHHPIFPDRCNIEFAELRGSSKIRVRVWERGTGITMACGTGACATTVAAVLTGRLSGQALVEMDGGELSIAWAGTGNSVLMTGPATTVFEGEIEL